MILPAQLEFSAPTQFLPLLMAILQNFRSVSMRNGFGEIENVLSTLLVHVERKEVEREDNFLQIMIKSLHQLHNKEKSKNFYSSLLNKVNG
jgi:hypothetical protein